MDVERLQPRARNNRLDDAAADVSSIRFRTVCT
jgi:hypothetical protein